MTTLTAHFKEHACFQTEWAGFEEFLTINVIVGRNNTGKSQLLDLIKELCNSKVSGNSWPVKLSCALQEKELRQHFQEIVAASDLPGNLWREHGTLMVGAIATWTMRNGAARDVQVRLRIDCNEQPAIERARANRIAGKGLLADLPPIFSGREFRHLMADRDIRPEDASNNMRLDPDGSGATNLIRRYITSSSFPREIIQRDLLQALNTIFQDDGTFTSIDVRQHDESDAGISAKWEVFLGESHKGLVALSKSGSGLKTVILVLLNLLVVPRIEFRDKKDSHIFAFEELENNLHPALLRRLLVFVEKHALNTASPVFLTTHSPVMIDILGALPHSQIIHVVHDGKTAKTTKIDAHFDKLKALSSLGARPSDLLQANGIIWLEGPSDRIYVNRWIELLSDGKLREGRHYQCAFYGGALLARYQANPPENEISELANFIRINPKIILICDSDRSVARPEIKSRVQRLRGEVAEIPGSMIWVTDAKEIENYLPGEVLSSAFSIENLPDPGQLETFFPAKLAASYLETQLDRKSIDKIELANQCAPLMTAKLMSPRFDWENQMKLVVATIELWNRDSC